MYIYKAGLIRVVSGDTIRCNVDLGFSIILQDIKIQLLNIDSPSGVEGERAKEFLINIMPKNFSIKTRIMEGLIIGEIMVGGENINEKLLESQLVSKFSKL